jgi:hypothetical protein
LAEDESAMMHSTGWGAGPSVLPELFEASLPPMRDKLPTLPYDLREYAQQSVLPDADDELVFTAGLPLDAILERVPALGPSAADTAALEPRESLLLSLIDGLSPVSMIVDLVGGDTEESLVVLCDLYARGYVAFG